MSLEWQAFGASDSAHLIDTDRKATKRSGRKAECGRYTGVRFEAWMAISVAEVWAESLPLGRFRCVDCAQILKEGLPMPGHLVPATPGENREEQNHG